MAEGGFDSNDPNSLEMNDVQPDDDDDQTALLNPSTDITQNETSFIKRLGWLRIAEMILSQSLI